MYGKIILVLLLALGLEAAPKKVVAEVNGQKITKEELDQAYLLNKYVVSEDPVTMKRVLTDLINKKLGVEKAKKAKLDKDPIVVRKLEEVIFNAQVSKDLEGEFQKIKVTDADVKKFYSEYPEYRTAHILLRVRVAPSENEINAAQKKIFEIHEKVTQEPSKFAEFANKYSQSPNAHTGGDVGYQPAFFMAPEYFAAIKGKKDGFITRPVRTQLGYHVIKVLGVKKYEDINMGAYKKFVYDRKRDRIIEDYFAGLRKKANIKILDKNLK
ncbi:peptidylprolyl isomerase [Halobacteriovorax sp. ZH4_bin.1]|uniref:peptidylprolyl isomerase n=1 Tax=unclassified Halobacteriovorax TaxID=2639665 RepID=UPI003717F512